MESNSSPHSQNVTLALQQIKSEAQTYNLLPGHSFIHSVAADMAVRMDHSEEEEEEK